MGRFQDICVGILSSKPEKIGKMTYTSINYKYKSNIAYEGQVWKLGECTSSVRIKLVLPRNISLMKEELSRCFHF